MFCCAYMYSVCDIVLCLPHIHQTMIEVIDISEYNIIIYAVQDYLQKIVEAIVLLCCYTAASSAAH